MLAGSVEGTSGGAGTFETTVALKNVSAASCPTGGYAGLQLVDAHGNQLPTQTLRGGTLNFEDIPVTSFVLAPGATAWFNIGYSDVPVGSQTSCAVASQLQVIPPGDVAHLAIAATIAACGSGTVHESPMFASGSPATQTTAPPPGG